MKERYLRYYREYSNLAPIVFAWDIICTRSKLKKISLKNRLLDYQNFQINRSLLPLHRELNTHLLASAQLWPDYDYGEGYFYQSLPAIGVTGLRDTQARISTMELRELLKNNIVVEIGCNTGFLSLSVAHVTQQIHGIDINPHLIEIGRATARYLGETRATFSTSSFERFHPKEPADVILSFANHSTYDGNTKQSLYEYFEKCHNLIRPKGFLLFESHHPDYEGQALLEDVCATIGQFFKILRRRVLNCGTFLDRGRTFIMAQKLDRGEKYGK